MRPWRVLGTPSMKTAGRFSLRQGAPACADEGTSPRSTLLVLPVIVISLYNFTGASQRDG